MNYFLGLNIADSPLQIIKTGFAAGSVVLVVGAAMIPILSALSQWVSAKLLSMSGNNQKAAADQNDTMAGTMKTMNNVMPLMSAVFCMTLPVGMGIYWIAGAVIRSIQQVIVNKRVDELDMEEVIRKNQEKANQERKKQGLPPRKETNAGKSGVIKADTEKKGPAGGAKKERREKAAESKARYKDTSGANAGSLAAKAQMVKRYNEKNESARY